MRDKLKPWLQGKGNENNEEENPFKALFLWNEENERVDAEDNDKDESSTDLTSENINISTAKKSKAKIILEKRRAEIRARRPQQLGSEALKRAQKRQIELRHLLQNGANVSKIKIYENDPEDEDVDISFESNFEEQSDRYLKTEGKTDAVMESFLSWNDEQPVNDNGGSIRAKSSSTTSKAGIKKEASLEASECSTLDLRLSVNEDESSVKTSPSQSTSDLSSLKLPLLNDSQQQVEVSVSPPISSTLYSPNDIRIALSSPNTSSKRRRCLPPSPLSESTSSVNKVARINSDAIAATVLAGFPRPPKLELESNDNDHFNSTAQRQNLLVRKESSVNLNKVKVEPKDFTTEADYSSSIAIEPYRNINNPDSTVQADANAEVKYADTASTSRSINYAGIRNIKIHKRVDYEAQRNVIFTPKSCVKQFRRDAYDSQPSTFRPQKRVSYAMERTVTEFYNIDNGNTVRKFYSQSTTMLNNYTPHRFNYYRQNRYTPIYNNRRFNRRSYNSSWR